MVRKTNLKVVASKKIVKVARPSVGPNAVPLVLPDDPLGYKQVREFILSNTMPSFGRLTKKCDASRAEVEASMMLFFREHPDEQQTGIYTFARHAAEMIFMFQTIGGKVSQLTMTTNAVRRGPKTIEYIGGLKDWCVKKEYLQEDGTLKTFEQVDTGIGAMQQTSELRHALPSLFHSDYQRLSAWLQNFTTRDSLAVSIKLHVGSLVAAVTPNNLTTEDAMSKVVFATAVAAPVSTDEDGALGRVQLQLFAADQSAIKAPFGLIDLGTIWVAGDTPNSHNERIGKIVTVRQNAFGAGPSTGKGWAPHNQTVSAWGAEGPTGNRWNEQSTFGTPGFSSSGPRYRSGDVWNPSRTIGQYGQMPPVISQQIPETFNTVTSSLDRFVGNLVELMEETPVPLNKHNISTTLDQIRMMFMNQAAAARNGQLLFEFQYVQGNSLLLIVRERGTNRTCYINTLQLL